MKGRVDYGLQQGMARWSWLGLSLNQTQPPMPKVADEATRLDQGRDGTLPMQTAHTGSVAAALDIDSAAKEMPTCVCARREVVHKGYSGRVWTDLYASASWMSAGSSADVGPAYGRQRCPPGYVAASPSLDVRCECRFGPAVSAPRASINDEGGCTLPLPGCWQLGMTDDALGGRGALRDMRDREGRTKALR